MWHIVVIEIEQNHPITSYSPSRGLSVSSIIQPCWNILYKAPIEYDELSSVRGPKDAEAFHGCEGWIEQNKVQGSKYAIMRMFII